MDVNAKGKGEFRISAESVAQLRLWLQDGIKAHVELERVTEAVKGAAEAGWPASYLMADALAPRSVEMDVHKAIDALALLDVLELVEADHDN